jgi:hypothetical protein
MLAFGVNMLFIMSAALRILTSSTAAAITSD